MFFTPICADHGEADGIMMISSYHYFHYFHYYHPYHDVSYNRNESQVIVMECKNLKKMDVGGLSGKSHIHSTFPSPKLFNFTSDSKSQVHLVTVQVHLVAVQGHLVAFKSI